ncbi:hypothetical protein HDU84_000116 [Entophlyctis sp. JEL0112]|nr:hypothetical protein HDU84_000116 [Entophlyctis sp. JEL0112]
MDEELLLVRKPVRKQKQKPKSGRDHDHQKHQQQLKQDKELLERQAHVVDPPQTNTASSVADQAEPSAPSFDALRWPNDAYTENAASTTEMADLEYPTVPSYQFSTLPQEVRYPHLHPDDTDQSGESLFVSDGPSLVGMEDQTTPTAPPIDLHENVLQTLVPVPLDDQILRRMYQNSRIDVMNLQSDDFCDDAKFTLRRDEFYAALREYESSFMNHELSDEKVNSNLSLATTTANKIWTMKKSTQKLTAQCLDGTNLVHIVNSESAELNEENLKFLESILTVEFKNLQLKKKEHLFYMKLLKLWIQSFIDEALCEIDEEYLATSSVQSENIDKLKSFLDVLFYFERPKGIDSNFSVKKPSDSTAFVRDVRGWISHIVGFFNKVAKDHHSHVLQHVLRCPGVGLWGSWFIQWHPPTSLVWSDAFLDRFLSEVHFFLSPLEELRKHQSVKDIEHEYLVESYKVLEEKEEWIVVEESEIADLDTVKAQLTFLSDEDYSVFFNQFNFDAMYYSFVESQIYLFKGGTGKKKWERDRLLLRIFAVTHFILERLSSGLFLFSARKYREILGLIANAVVNVVKILQDRIIGCFTLEFDTLLNVTATLTTSLQSEMDSCFVRAASILLNRTRAGTWEYLKNLPCRFLSGQKVNIRSLSRGFQDESTFRDDDMKGISSAIDSNPIEAKYLLSFLTRLCTVGADSGYQLRLKELVAKILFHFGFLEIEHRDSLKSDCADFLATLCSTSPQTISLITSWTRKNFPAMGHLSSNLYQRLPVSLWCPTTADFDGFVAMLRSPSKSEKFKLAQTIIQHLNWGLKEESTELFIPRSFHRFLAFALCNLYLDKTVKAPLFSINNALSTSAALSKGRISALIPSNDGDFYDWCWATVIRLCLYQRATSRNTYVLDADFLGRSKPFETLESAQLATLRGAMKTESLAAYILLMVSDIGHSVIAFEKDGWAIMQLLLDDKRWESIINVINSLFLSFVSTEGFEFISSKRFATFFSVFLKQCKRELISLSSLCEGTSSMDIESCVRFMTLWTRISFIDPYWMNNRVCLQLLDTIAQFAMENGICSRMCDELQREYVRLIELRKLGSSHGGEMSFLHPIETLHVVASTIGDYLSSYPTLVSGNNADWYTSLPGANRKIPCETELMWFAFVALMAETAEEANLRDEIGISLSEDSQVPVSQVVRRFDEKPCELFAIYRWCNQIFECPIDHPLLPLFIQEFFILYFEKCSNPIVAMNECFGFRFFSESRHMLDRLQKRLNQFISQLHSSDSAEMRSLISLQNAALLWLQDASLLSTKIHLGHLNPSYCPAELGAIIHKTPGTSCELWKQFFPKISVSPKQKTTRFSDPQQSPGAGDDELVVKETSLPGMPWVSRKPIAVPFSQMTIASATQILKNDFQALLLKAQDSAKVTASQIKCDKDYLEGLSQMYVNNVRSGRYERRCGPSCLGAAQFRFSFREVQVQNDVMHRQRENRAQFDSLVGWDNADSRVTVSVLRIVRAVEWAAKVNEEQKSKISSVFVDFLFKVIEQPEDIRQYPPLIMVVQRTIALIGGRYVFYSADSTRRIFKIIQRTGGSASSEFLIEAFNPAVVLDEFCEMYGELSSRPELSVATLQKFNLIAWLDNSSPEKTSEFLETLLTIFEKHQGAEDIKKQHLTNLRDFLLHPTSDAQLVDHLMLLTTRFVDGLVSDEVYATTMLAVNLCAEVDMKNVSQGFELLDLRLSRHQALEFVARLNQHLASIFNRYENGVYGLRESVLKKVVEMLMLVFCSNPMFSMVSDIERLRIVSEVRHLLCLILFGVGRVRGSDELKPWVFSQDMPAFTAVASLAVGCLPKIFRSLAMVDSMMLEVWNWFETAVNLGAPQYIVSSVHNLIKVNGLSWNLFVATANFASIVWSWKEKKYFTADLQCVLGDVLSVCIWPPTADIHNLYLLYLIAANADVIWPAVPQRAVFFENARSRVTFTMSSKPISMMQLETLISMLPKRWEKENLTSMSKFSEGSCFGFCWTSILRLASSDDNLVLIAYSYFFELLDGQISSVVRSSGPPSMPSKAKNKETFSTKFLPSIVSEILGQCANPPHLESQALGSILGIVNKAPRSHFGPLWDGVVLALSQTETPLHWLAHTCVKLASAEAMAILCEKCIERFVSLKMENEIAGWCLQVAAVLVVPELESREFIAVCLQHGLGFVLYVHGVQRVTASAASSATATTSAESVATIGSDVADWICRLNKNVIGESSENKLLLLVDLFAQLVERNIRTMKVPAHQSRLHSMLPNVAEALLKWCEPANLGLWTTLGLTAPTSKLSASFRLFSKCVATFIAMRLFEESNGGPGGSGLDDERKESFVAQVRSLVSQREYSEWGADIEVAVRLLENENLGLSSLRSCVLEASRFCAFVQRGGLFNV